MHLSQNPMEFNWAVRVYYEDTDAGGIVYHARYLHFLERARTEWLRALGFNQSELKKQNIVFVVRDMAIHFHKPARLDDELTVDVRIEQIKRASISMQQAIRLGDQTLVTAEVTVPCLQADTLKPCPLPESMSKRIHEAQEEAQAKEF